MDKLQIYLDDIRIPTDKDWIVVRSYEEFVSLLARQGNQRQSLTHLRCHLPFKERT